MSLPNPMPVGCCLNGPVLLSESDELEYKFVVSIVKYDNRKHRNTVACKTTGKNHEKIYAGEFIVDDLFGRGASKIQPFNIVRMPNSDLSSHRYIGSLDASCLPKFEKGLRIAIQKQLLNPKEVLWVVDSWSSIFSAAI